MKADKSKTHLEQAIRSLPDSHHYRNARFYIAKALNEISTTDAKREGKKIANLQQQWQDKIKTDAIAHPMTVDQQKDALSQLDKLIELEQTKIEEARKKRDVQPESDDGLFFG